MKNTILVNGKRKTCRIYDAGANFADRYTIAFKGYRTNRGMCYPYLAASDRPFHPQGFGQHGESNSFIDGKHLGKRVSFFDMTEEVQKFIIANI